MFAPRCQCLCFQIMLKNENLKKNFDLLFHSYIFSPNKQNQIKSLEGYQTQNRIIILSNRLSRSRALSCHPESATASSLATATATVHSPSSSDLRHRAAWAYWAHTQQRVLEFESLRAYRREQLSHPAHAIEWKLRARLKRGWKSGKCKD